MKKVALPSLLLFLAFSLSCSFVKSPGTPAESTPAGTNLTLKVDAASSRTVSGSEAEVVSMDIAVKSQDGSQSIAAVHWEKSGTVSSYSFCLDLNKGYRLEVAHHYYDSSNVLRTANDDPFLFSLKPGRITVITVVPGGIAVVDVAQAGLAVDSFAIDPPSPQAGSGLTMNATVSATGWASVTGVSADLSLLGGSASAAFVRGSGDAWSLSYQIPASQAAGDYTIVLYAVDAANGISASRSAPLTVAPPPSPSPTPAASPSPAESPLPPESPAPSLPPSPSPLAALAFPNSDMEADMENAANGLKPTGSGYESTLGRDGATTRALHVLGSNASNSFVFTSAGLLNPQGDFTKISFWLRGSITGGAKSISVQIGSSASAAGQIFPCGDLSADKTVNGASVHSYTGSLNTNGAWIKVSLNLMGTSSPAVVPAAVTAGNAFSLKVGGASGVSCDFWVDDIIYE